MNTERAATGLAGLLARLRRITHETRPLTPLPAPPERALREVASDENLPARFTAAAERAGCQVWQADAQTWVAVIQQILRGLPAQSVLIEAQPGTALTPERCQMLADALAGDQVRACTAPDDATLFTVDAGITGARSAIAETGTVVCVSGAAAARGASLIPPVHIVVLEETQILADLFDYFEQLDPQELPANVNMITGPSKTADIEGVLVTGMHGPGAVHVILLAR
jgi:L-lactate dehydrogenase complex protein LldG